MEKLFTATLLTVLSTSVLAVEPPLTLDTEVIGEVTVGEAVLASSALIASGIALGSGGGSSNGGTTGATDTSN